MQSRFLNPSLNQDFGPQIATKEISVFDAIQETSFSKLHEWVDKFVAEDGLSFLIVYGPPGVSKSQSFKAKLGSASVIEGRLTGVMMYQRLWELKDKPLVF